MQSDFRLGIPAQVLVDYYFAEAIGIAGPGFETSPAVLRQQAMQALRAGWAGSDRSVAIQVVTANEIGEPLRPKRLEYALDTGTPIAAIEKGDHLRTRTLTFSAPAGSHLLELAADYSKGDSTVHLRSRRAFTVSSGERIRATVTIRSTADGGMTVEFSGISSPLSGFDEPRPQLPMPAVQRTDASVASRTLSLVGR